MWNMVYTGQESLTWLQPKRSWEQEGGQEQEWLAKKISRPEAWSFSSSSSSSSCCASTDCYQPHTSPPIRVRAAVKRSARRQLIGRDGYSRRLVANGHPDAPDVTHTAPSVLSAQQAREDRHSENNKACSAANEEKREQTVQSCSNAWIKNLKVY